MGYLLGVYEKSMPGTFTLKEKLACAKAAGFDYMEISIDETDEKLSRLDWENAVRRELVDAMWEIGLPIKSMCLSGHRKYPLGSLEQGTARRSLEIMEKAVVLAGELGVRVIQLAGYDEYYRPSTEKTRENFEVNLRKSVEIAAKHGVILAFETMETEFMDTVGKAEYYVEKINSPYLKIYPDVGNVTNAMVKYHQEILTDFEKGRGNIVAAHLKATRPGVYRDMLFGEGHVDFPLIAGWLRENGVGMYVAEFWYKQGQEPLEYLKQANVFLRQYL